MKEKVTTKMVTICSTKPERQCTKPDGPSFRDDKKKQKCRNVYETGKGHFFQVLLGETIKSKNLHTSVLLFVFVGNVVCTLGENLCKFSPKGFRISKLESLFRGIHKLRKKDFANF